MPGLAMPLEGVDAVVATHNVVGQGGVLNVAAARLGEKINAHYAPRGIDHLPYDPTVRCFILTPEPDAMREQIAYRENLAGMTITPIADLSEMVNYGVKSALHLPYIRLIDEPFPASIQWRRYGLPPGITARLKDKNFMHPWMLNRGHAAHVPNFIGCLVDEIPQRARRMLRQIETMLDEFEMRGRYPSGIVIRGALSDGNYGMASITEMPFDQEIDGIFVQKGQWILKPDGQTNALEVFEGAEAALNRAVEHLHTQNDTGLDDRVILTRLLDVEVSPGLCAVVAGGEIFDFPFNGQYMEPGHTACTGTWSFSAAVGHERAAQYSKGYLAQTQTLLRDILGYFFHNMDTRDIFAMLNIDVMIVGDLERELHARASAANAGFYLDDYGYIEEEYRPRIHNPERVLFAEVNPRDTNWTIAMKAVLQALRMPCTVDNLLMLAAGQPVQVLALDHWALPTQVTVQPKDGNHPAPLSISSVRGGLEYFQSTWAKDGEGVIMRMPDNPAGMIFYSRSPRADRLKAFAEDVHNMIYVYNAGGIA